MTENLDSTKLPEETVDVAVPHDEHGNEATGICMNCGAAMVENPMYPWCIDCEDE
jgi:hypothetical protein